MFWNRLKFLDVFKTQRKPLYFACFSCARRSVRMMKPRILKPNLDTSIVHFFGVQRSDWDFNFEVSRGRFGISTLRCPEVRLGFQLWCVRKSDWFWFVRTSDYRFNLRCPEVGLQLCVHPDPSFGLFGLPYSRIRRDPSSSGVPDSVHPARPRGRQEEIVWLSLPCGRVNEGEGEICQKSRGFPIKKTRSCNEVKARSNSTYYI